MENLYKSLFAVGGASASYLFGGGRRCYQSCSRWITSEQYKQITGFDYEA